MKRQALLVCAAAALALAGGWLTAQVEHTATLQRSNERSGATGLDPNGKTVGRAGERFARIGARSDDIATDGGEPADDMVQESIPVEQDIAVTFRRDLTAIERMSLGLIVWVVDLNQASGRRALAIGDIYQDGWRVAGIDSQMVELRRGRDNRRIGPFDAVEPASQ
jgi:hypothetical protein